MSAARCRQVQRLVRRLHAMLPDSLLDFLPETKDERPKSTPADLTLPRNLARFGIAVGEFEGDAFKCCRIR